MDVLLLGGGGGIPTELAEAIRLRGHHILHQPELKSGLREYARAASPCVVVLPDVLGPATVSSLRGLNVGSPLFLLALTGAGGLTADEVLALGAHDVARLPSTTEGLATRLAVGEMRLAEWAGKQPPSSSDGWLRIVFQNMREGVLLQTREGVIHACNPAAEQVMAMTQDQMRGQRSADPEWAAIHEDGRPMRNDERPGYRAITSGQPVTNAVMGVRSAGRELRWVSVSSVPLFRPSAEQPYGVVSSFVDITPLVRAQHAQQRTQQDLLRILERAPDAMIITRGGQVVLANPAFVRALGLPDTTAAEGRQLLSLVDPADHARLQSNTELAEIRFLRPHGAPVILEVAAPQMLELEGGPAVLLMARDVTERHHLQARLMLADRLASVGTLAAGVAHEVNNPLSYVLGNLFSLQEVLGDALLDGPDLTSWRGTAREMLKDALHGGERIRKIVAQMRMFARAEEEQVEAVDVGSAMEMAIRMCGNQIRARAHLDIRVGHAPPVMANEAHLVQVFLNLLINALHALPEQATEPQAVVVTVNTAPDGRVAASVQDTGSGIAPQHLAHIFDPFFTTKPVGSGTGLGLSVVHTLVTAMGGEVVVDSTPGKGSRFTVLLPQGGVLATRPAVTLPTQQAPIIRGRVLVVDDDEMVRKMLVRTLQRDHDVVSAPDVGGAMQVLRTQPVDVVICDLVMEMLGGADLYDFLSEELPHLAPRVVFLTGGAFTARASQLLERVPNQRMNKPVLAARLRAVIQDMLERLGPVKGMPP